MYTWPGMSKEEFTLAMKPTDDEIIAPCTCGDQSCTGWIVTSQELIDIENMSIKPESAPL